MKKDSFTFVTLGCKVENQYESEAMAKDFTDAGYTYIRSADKADIVIVNTCAVTQMAESKGRQAIRQIRKANPGAFVVVAGCYGQRAGADLMRIDGVSLVVGNGEKENILRIVEATRKKGERRILVGDISKRHVFPQAEVTVKENNRVRAYLKIQDGCEQFCTYCIVPYVRGPVVSRSYQDILREGAALAADGYREIVLIGIHTGFYGRDLKDGSNLVRVLKGLLRETDIPRIRLSSLEPLEVGDDLLDLMAAEPRLCPHFHIPLQSGDDEILEKMGRKYTADDYLAITERIFCRLPGAAISSDVMVGFPGETEKNFRHTLRTIQLALLAFIHGFPYSPRPGTKAASFPNQVPMAIREERQQRLLQVGALLKQSYAEQFLGRDLSVLVESRDGEGYYWGHTPNYLKVRFKDSALDLAGKFRTVQGIENQQGILIGKLRNEG